MYDNDFEILEGPDKLETVESISDYSDKMSQMINNMGNREYEEPIPNLDNENELEDEGIRNIKINTLMNQLDIY